MKKESRKKIGFSYVCNLENTNIFTYIRICQHTYLEVIVPNLKKNIFNRKKLAYLISKYDFTEFYNSNERQSILNDWINFVNSNSFKATKETSLQGSFIDSVFGVLLGYKNQTVSPELWNLTHEQVTHTGATFADGALGFFKKGNSVIHAVIELKDPKTNLDEKQNRFNDNRTPVEQAFSYQHKIGKECRWVIVSNFNEIRLYHESSSTEYEVFFISDFDNRETVKKFIYLMGFENLVSQTGDSLTDKLFKSNEQEERDISKQFYSVFKHVRINLFNHLKEQNPESDELILIEKTQKLLDRFIFICFCEDNHLLPEQIFKKIVANAETSFSFSETKIWNEVRGLFHAINAGSPPHNINKFNGGLFAKDEVLDSLHIKDGILKEMSKITEYDFDSDIDVNILGHIFEQSINDLEELKSQIEGKDFDKKTSKRKKDGIFYTPEYITKYIVENAVGGWLGDRKKELGYYELPELIEDDYKSIATLKGKAQSNQNIIKHLQFWTEYKTVLMNIKVLDPACGSGAFLNQAFNYLYAEGQNINETIAMLTGGQRELFELDKHILTNNLYGVDLNPESVEISKLSLWLKTANKYSELTALDNNIKCGNSLIDDPEVAGDKAFNWSSEFPDIMSAGGFDVVIGNPPYVRQESIDKNDKEFLSQKYKVGNGSADLYVYFYEKALKLLKYNGLLGYITPNKWFKTKYGINLRKFLFDYRIIEITDFFELPIFQDASTEPQIILIQNCRSLENFKYYPVSSANEFISSLINYSIIDKSNLNNDSWILSNMNNNSILSKIYNNTITLKDYTNNGIEYGIKTGFNKAFIIDEHTKNKLVNEDPKSKELIKKYVSGTDIGKWHLNLIEKQYFINTYYDIDITQYSAIHKYLLQFNDELENRQDKGKTHFNLRSCNYYDKFETPKLLYIHTAVSHNFYYDTDNYYVNNSCYFISNVDKFLACWLNSSIFNFLKRLIFVAYGDAANKGRAKLDYNKMVNIPIPNISEIQKLPFIELADIMLEKNKELQEIKNKFLDLLKADLSIDKLSTKLQNWYELSWADFSLELKKLKIELKGEMKEDWSERFNRMKVKAIEIKNIIDTTDRKIDLLVYELYELTEEEIKIVEGE